MTKLQIQTSGFKRKVWICGSACNSPSVTADFAKCFSAEYVHIRLSYSHEIHFLSALNPPKPAHFSCFETAFTGVLLGQMTVKGCSRVLAHEGKQTTETTAC